MDCQADVAGRAKVWVPRQSRIHGEPAILDLMGEVAILRGDLPTVLEHGALGDSQSNGFVERAIRSVEDMIRTHKMALEEKIGEVLKNDTAAMAWLVEHCANILFKCQQGKDGRTPFERLRGKQFSGSMMEFGSQVLLKVMDKQRCNAIRRGQTYGTDGHSADCSRRVEAALAQDEE